MTPAANRRLLARLASALADPAAARNELRWLRDATPNDDARLASYVDRRVRGEPLQYILGTQPFGPLDILVRPPVLIPRPETEHWALRLAHALRPTPSDPARVLDLCTGTGCIPLLLCALWPQGSARAVGVDIAHEALALAADNARASDVAPLDLASAALSSDLAQRPRRNAFTPLYADILTPPHVLARTLPLKPYTLLTANPPYIPPADIPTLDCSVREHEDMRALVGADVDGLGFYRAIAALLATSPSSSSFSSNHDEDILDPRRAVVALEVGKGQARAVRSILEHARVLDGTTLWTDPWGVERVVVGWRGPNRGGLDDHNLD